MGKERLREIRSTLKEKLSQRIYSYKKSHEDPNSLVEKDHIQRQLNREMALTIIAADKADIDITPPYLAVDEALALEKLKKMNFTDVHKAILQEAAEDQLVTDVMLGTSRGGEIHIQSLEAAKTYLTKVIAQNPQLNHVPYIEQRMQTLTNTLSPKA